MIQPLQSDYILEPTTPTFYNTNNPLPFVTHNVQDIHPHKSEIIDQCCRGEVKERRETV